MPQVATALATETARICFTFEEHFLHETARTLLLALLQGLFQHAIVHLWLVSHVYLGRLQLSVT